MLPQDTAWTANANDDWLHLSLENQSRAGSTNVVFSYDANPGATRSGTVTIGSQTLTVTQAGSTYVPAGVTTLVSSGLSEPNGVAVDGAGNVYIADAGSGDIKKWTPTNNAVTTLVASGLNVPVGVAVDSAGNVYIGDSHNNALKKWTVANKTVSTLASGSSALNSWAPTAWRWTTRAMFMFPPAVQSGSGQRPTTTFLRWCNLKPRLRILESYGVAVDGAGNIYIADTPGLPRAGRSSEWTPANGNLTTLVVKDDEFPKRGGGQRGQCLHCPYSGQFDREVVGGQQHA